MRTKNLTARERKIMTVLHRIVRVSTAPGMIDPFNDSWHWRYQADDLLTKYNFRLRPSERAQATNQTRKKGSENEG